MSTPERPQARPRSSSRFSFKSDKSGGNTKPKIDLKETAEEKRRSHFTLTKKTNPNAAINEAQPVAAQLEASTIGSLRSIQHTDSNGNPIAEPDLSNPTRPRWERPLDTIRSFERSIDAGYKRRSTMARPDSSPNTADGFASRRSSYYGGYDQNSPSRYSQVGGYYGGRARDSYMDNSYGSPAPAGPSRNRFAQRVQSDMMLHRYNNGHGYNGSRDTVTTGVSNGSQSEPWGNSTDPSSENSSIDKPHPAPRADYDEQYGHSIPGRGPGFQHPIVEESGYRYGDSAYYQLNKPLPTRNDGYPHQNYNGAPPPAPAHATFQGAAAKQPIRLGGAGTSQPLTASSGNSGAGLQHTPSQKKGWFKRKFSKG